jgi:hypothetical protein
VGFGLVFRTFRRPWYYVALIIYNQIADVLIWSYSYAYIWGFMPFWVTFWLYTTIHAPVMEAIGIVGIEAIRKYSAAARQLIG